ncbi:hypothetical protein RCOM_0423960 [Ricinus communis]|uniref:Uncharacterized protein n=1 Tax=Ricinus communis TaxID=3988 RepID=B9T470_RICCO|nr:hypothetical protein RCOM_0423960 [Ricinus communis]
MKKLWWKKKKLKQHKEAKERSKYTSDVRWTLLGIVVDRDIIAVNTGIIRPGDDVEKAVVQAAEFREFLYQEHESMMDHFEVMMLDLSLPVEVKMRVAVRILIMTLLYWIESSSTVTSSLRRGRHVFSNMQKYVHLHLAAMIVALTLNVAAGISCVYELFSPLQVLWVSLIGDTLGAFALAIDIPNQITLTTPLIHDAGKAVFNVDRQAVVNAMIFSSLSLRQTSLMLNARHIGKTKIFENLHKNCWFSWAVVAMVLLQVIFVEVLSCFNPEAVLDLCKNGSKIWLKISLYGSSSTRNQ